MQSIWSKSSQTFQSNGYTKSSVMVSIEKPISLVDLELKIGEKLTSVKKISFKCDSIEFDLLFETCLPYLYIRSIELTDDLKTCKCLLFIQINRSFITNFY